MESTDQKFQTFFQVYILNFLLICDKIAFPEGWMNLNVQLAEHGAHFFIHLFQIGKAIIKKFLPICLVKVLLFDFAFLWFSQCLTLVMFQLFVFIT